MTISDIGRGATRLPAIGDGPVRVAALLLSCLVACGPLPGTERDGPQDVGSAGARAAREEHTNSPAYSGSARCRPCHERFHELWSTSYHGIGIRAFNVAALGKKLPPGSVALTRESGTVTIDVRPDRGWMVLRNGSPPERMRMDYVLGGRSLLYFFGMLERGRLQTLPAAYDVGRNEWFSVPGSAVRHFLENDRAVDWTHRGYTFGSACYRCHVSQSRMVYDGVSDTYAVTWAESGISCETCHGPGADHVRVCEEAGEGVKPADLRIVGVAGMTVAQRNDLCSPCHALAEALTPHFPPGERFLDHFDPATLEDPEFYADGRAAGETYTYTSWMMSPCVRAGSLDCMHCHTSSGRFRFASDPDRSCLPCHAARVSDGASHSGHRSGGRGSRCVECHMPVKAFARIPRSDHSMLPPSPAVSSAAGSKDACTGCHADKSPGWAEKWIRSRRKPDREPGPDWVPLLQAARRGDWSQLGAVRSYLVRKNRNEVVAASLLKLLRDCPDTSKTAIAVQAISDGSPLIRAAGARALEGNTTHTALLPLVRACSDEFRLVRVRAAAALAGVPPGLIPAAELDGVGRATGEYLASLEVRPDAPGAHLNRGNFHMERGSVKDAIEAFEAASRLDPEALAPLVNAAVAHAAAGDRGNAEASLRRALAIDPNHAPANFNLGLLLAEIGQRSAAETALRKAYAADSSSARTAYNLAVLIGNDRPGEASELCAAAARLRPDDPDYAYTGAFYLRRSNAHGKAIDVLRSLTGRHKNFPDGYGLLADILLELGRRDEAAAVYRDALARPGLPPEPRRAFGKLLERITRPSDAR